MRNYLLNRLGMLFKNVRYKIRHGLAKGLIRRGGLGFLYVIFPAPKLTKEELFLKTLVLENKIVFDVGGLNGMFTLFFARKVGPKGGVFTFEPNPHSFRSIQQNCLVNGFDHVRVLNIALGDRDQEMVLNYNSYDPGRGSLEAALDLKGQKHSILVSCKRLDQLIEDSVVPPPDFVKIDTEGFEESILIGMSSCLIAHKPHLFIEVHDISGKPDNMENILNLLRKYHYSSIYHVETDQYLESCQIDVTTGHIYVT